MAAACKALPRCTRAYSAVIDRQATLSYECVDSRNRAAYACAHRMRWSSSSSAGSVISRLPLAHRLPATPFHRGPLAAMLDISFTL